MDVMVQRCAGLDVHRDSVVATVRVPGSARRRWDQQTQTFAATLAGLAELAAWLAAAGVTLVGMEATGVYWKTVFQALEDQFECWLLNAHHLRNVHDPRRSSPRRPGPDRRMRTRHELVPDRRALRVLGRRVPGPQPVSRPATLGAHPPRTTLADRPADRVRTRRGPNQRDLPRRALRAAPRTAR
jgi:Transposase